MQRNPENRNLQIAAYPRAHGLSGASLRRILGQQRPVASAIFGAHGAVGGARGDPQIMRSRPCAHVESARISRYICITAFLPPSSPSDFRNYPVYSGLIDPSFRVGGVPRLLVVQRRREFALGPPTLGQPDCVGLHRRRRIYLYEVGRWPAL